MPEENITQGGATVDTNTTPSVEPQKLSTQTNDRFIVEGVNDDNNFTQASDEQIAELTAPEPTPIVEQPVTPEPTPVVPETAPVAQEVVTPAPVAETIVEDVVTPAPIPKVETVSEVQDVKTKELSNQALEEQQDTQRQVKLATEFINTVRSGNLDDARKIAMEHPEMRGNFNSAIKGYLKDKEGADFFSKYSGISNEQMLSEVKAGNIVPGSEKYNTLPQEQRAAFEQYKTQVDALELDQKKNYNEENADVLSLQEIFEQQKGLMVDPTLKGKIDDALNSDELNNTAKGLEDIQNKIDESDQRLEDIVKEVQEDFSHLPLSAQNAIIRDRQEDELRNKNTLVNQYNSKLGTYQTLKDNANLEVQMLMFENSQTMEAYKTSLGLYETRRAEMREDQKMQFIETNRRLATETAFENQKILAEFNDNLRKNNLGGGQYIDDGEGNIVYIKDGKQISVLEGLGDTVDASEDPNYTYQIRDNGDGTRTVFGLPKKNGLNIYSETFGADAEPSQSYIESTGTGKITSYGGPHDKGRGLDIDGNIGDPVTVPLSGEIVQQVADNMFGNTTVVKLEDGTKIRFSHLDESYGNVGDIVPAGYTIGTIGNTGNVKKLDGTRPSRQELKQGFGSHLDIVTQKPDGEFRTAKETEAYLNNLFENKDQIIQSGPDYQLAQSILNGVGDLNKLTPTQRGKITPIVDKLLTQQMTGDEDRNLILRSSLNTKELSETQLEKITDMNIVRGQLDRLEETLKGQNTGPISGQIMKFNAYDTDAQIALAQLAGLTPKVARGIFGEVGVLTDADIQNYQRALPNLTSTQEKNELVIDFMRDLLTAGYKNALITQAKGGRNVSQFLPDYDALTGIQRTNKYSGAGRTYSTSSGFSYQTSGTKNKQDEFFKE